jgi:hypothetical protein
MAIKNLIDSIYHSASSLVRMKEATHAHVPAFSYLSAVMANDRDYL